MLVHGTCVICAEKTGCVYMECGRLYIFDVCVCLCILFGGKHGARI